MTDTERAKKVQQERSGSQDAGDLVNRQHDLFTFRRDNRENKGKENDN